MKKRKKDDEVLQLNHPIIDNSNNKVSILY